MSLRVFIDAETDGLAAGREATLSIEESHYLVRVRRARLGAPIEVLAGRRSFAATVVDPSVRGARVLIEWPIEVPQVPALGLALGLPEPSAAIEAIVAACEIGATEISLIRCTRTPAGAPTTDRIARVLRSAQRQCGRPIPPLIAGPSRLDDWLARLEGRAGVFGCQAVNEPPAGEQRPCPSWVLIGPEGGLTREETDRARAAGLRPISLGPWTLRTPTAVAVGLAHLQQRMQISHSPADSGTPSDDRPDRSRVQRSDGG